MTAMPGSIMLSAILGTTHFLTLRDPFLGRQSYFGNRCPKWRKIYNQVTTLCSPCIVLNVIPNTAQLINITMLILSACVYYSLFSESCAAFSEAMVILIGTSSKAGEKFTVALRISKVFSS